MGVGAAGFGVLALHTGYPIAFVLVALVLVATVLPGALAPRHWRSVRDRRTTTM
jgi:hypothetical protein